MSIIQRSLIQIRVHVKRSFSTHANQTVSIDPQIKTELQAILNTFKAPKSFAFGYGSSVFKQAGYTEKDKPQIDMIIAVDNIQEWHAINIKQNPHHYSTLRLVGPKLISKFQDLGAGVYFNPFVDIGGLEVKYGVVPKSTLLRDLSTWDTFYLAGRLQKPVAILKSDNEVLHWNQVNLNSAATLAKYMTTTDVNSSNYEFDFYTAITGLSYTGDLRFKMGAENPKKITNIVSKNFHHFQEYYAPIYKQVVEGKLESWPSTYTRENAMKMLSDRIFRTSVIETCKGVATAGFVKSIKYGWAKKMKARK